MTKVLEKFAFTSLKRVRQEKVDRTERERSKGKGPFQIRPNNKIFFPLCEFFIIKKSLFRMDGWGERANKKLLLRDKTWDKTCKTTNSPKH